MLRRKCKKYITYSIPIKKEVSYDDVYGEDDGDGDGDGEKKKTVEYRLSFIDSYGLIPDNLSDVADNLSGIHDKKCKKCMKGKN